MKRVIKWMIVFFLYFVLVIGGFIGGCETSRVDIWDNLIKWSKK